MLSQLLFLLNLLPERCFAIFMAGVLARRKNRKTFSSSLLPLCVSVPLVPTLQRSGRVVNHIRRAGALLFNGRSNSVPSACSNRRPAGT